VQRSGFVTPTSPLSTTTSWQGQPARALSESDDRPWTVFLKIFWCDKPNAKAIHRLLAKSWPTTAIVGPLTFWNNSAVLEMSPNSTLLGYLHLVIPLA